LIAVVYLLIIGSKKQMYLSPVVACVQVLQPTLFILPGLKIVFLYFLAYQEIIKSVLVNISFASFIISFISFILTSYIFWDTLSSMETNKKSTTKDMVNLLNEDYKETMNSGYKRSNRFTGESIQLTKEEANKYDAIINNEWAATQEDNLRQDVGISELWNAVRRDLDWFRKHNAKAYMVLLD